MALEINNVNREIEFINYSEIAVPLVIAGIGAGLARRHSRLDPRAAGLGACRARRRFRN